MMVLEDLDVCVYVRYLRDKLKVLGPTEYLTSVQAGFIYNTGRARFVIDKLEFAVDPMPPAQDTPIVCYVGDFDSQAGICRCPEVINSTMINLISTPTVGILLRISPLLSLMD